MVGLDLFGIFWEIMWLSWNVVERVGNLRIAIMWDLVLELGFWYIVKDHKKFTMNITNLSMQI